jgi:glycosyltransferase involved in cell wall biosynthesis
MAEESKTAETPLRVLIVRGSFNTLGGGERELLQLIRHASKRWQVSLATLQFPQQAQDLLGDCEIEIIQPKQPFTWPQGAITEITAGQSSAASKEWKKLKIDWSNYDVAHLSVCRGTLEILNSASDKTLRGKGLHYHCLEPPRWLYEDVLHRHMDGTLKRPLWLTNLIFANQRRIDQKLVNRLAKMKGSAISGNSMWIQKQLRDIYGFACDEKKANGSPPRRNSKGQMLEATHLMHVLDWDLWPQLADEDEKNVTDEIQQAVISAQKNSAETESLPDEYVVTIGKLSFVKGAWETVQSLQGTGLSLVQIGGGDQSDKDKILDHGGSLGVDVYCMPRLSQSALRAVIRGAVAMVSHAHGEPFGLTPLEAMAIGVPALMVDEGGFHYTMNTVDSGILISREDYESWDEAYRLAQDDENRELWAVNGRKYVEENFTINNQIEALENLLLECVKSAQ